MPLITLDASVLIKVLLPEREEETGVSRALALWQRVGAGRIALRQPAHWLAEIAAVLSRLSPGTVLDDVRDLVTMEVPVLEGPEIYRTACRLAVELDHHLFDTLYHAVALESDDGVLITADERYVRKAQAHGRIIRLEDYNVGS